MTILSVGEWWLYLPEATFVFEASISLAESICVHSRNWRQPKLATHSWPTMRLYTRHRGNAKRWWRRYTIHSSSHDCIKIAIKLWNSQSREQYDV